MLYLYFSNQPASSSHLQLRYVQPWHWRSRSSEGLLGGSNSWEFRGNFSTRIAQHIPQRLAIRIWGGWIFFEYSYHERIELENDFCWDVLIMMMTPPPWFWTLRSSFSTSVFFVWNQRLLSLTFTKDSKTRKVPLPHPLKHGQRNCRPGAWCHGLCASRFGGRSDEGFDFSSH